MKEQLASHHVSPESVAETRQHLSSLSGDTKYHVFEDGRQMGWALKKRRRNTQFSDKQIDFLVKIFDDGEKSGKKKDQSTVAELMRTAEDEEGAKMFTTNEYLGMNKQLHSSVDC